MSTSGYNGSQLLDEDGHPIGKVKDVVYDPSSGTPAWLVVKTGLLRGDHYVPAEGAYRSSGEDVVVPYKAQDIKAAPKAGHDHVMSADLKARLADHYHLAS